MKRIHQDGKKHTKTYTSSQEKLADMGASAHTYKSIRCKIINLQAARLLILQAEDY